MEKKVIVITGPIGSGKSEVLSIINRLGYNTVDLDAVYGEILLSEESKNLGLRVLVGKGQAIVSSTDCQPSTLRDLVDRRFDEE